MQAFYPSISSELSSHSSQINRIFLAVQECEIRQSLQRECRVYMRAGEIIFQELSTFPFGGNLNRHGLIRVFSSRSGTTCSDSISKDETHCISL